MNFDTRITHKMKYCNYKISFLMKFQKKFLKSGL